MSTSSSTKEEEIEDQAQEGWKSTLSGWGCLQLLVLFDSIGGLEKENILSICPTGVFIHTFHEPLSA